MLLADGEYTIVPVIGGYHVTVPRFVVFGYALL